MITVQDHAPLTPGTIYVVPSNSHVALTDHDLALLIYFTRALQWRRAGWMNMADAVRATGASVTAALAFIGASVTLT